ncbi:MAG: ribonuclease H-like domain-containing protein, partial [Candidatus Acidiferrales bacterium]
FNGKSFDWPLLETRYRMTRSVKAPNMRAHLDFLHPARNLWRMQIGSVRLADLERHVLGWKREGDVVSQMIPQLYFDYLRGGSPDALVPIFYHNQMDLRGLAALANRTLSLLADPETHGKGALELFGVSRLCERRGQTVRARKLYEQSLEADLPPPADRAARRSLARMARRDGNFALAAELWESIVGSSREGLEAYEQLAIYCERHSRDAARAISISRRALAELRNSNRLGQVNSVAYRKTRARWEHRLKRLERKTKQPRLDARGI